MNNKKLIIYTAATIVALCLAFLGKQFIQNKKASTSEKFEYVKMTIDEKEVECKYAKFETPIQIDRLKLIKGIDNLSSVAQWVQHIQYTANVSDSPKEFRPEMYNPTRQDRVDVYRENWEKILASEKKYADKILEQKENLPMDGLLKGILFLRYDQIDYAIFRYEYGSADQGDSTGGFAVVLDNKLIVPDDEIYKLDYKLITKCFGPKLPEIIDNLYLSKSGLLKVKDPLHWNIR